MTVEVMRKVGQVTFDSHWTLASSYSNYQSGSNLESPYAPLLLCARPVHAAAARCDERGLGDPGGQGAAISEQRQPGA